LIHVFSQFLLNHPSFIPIQIIRSISSHLMSPHHISSHLISSHRIPLIMTSNYMIVEARRQPK
jgi:hypothetical protein